MSKPDKDAVLAEFSTAYEKHHGSAPNIEASGGWFSIDGGKKVRLAQLQAMTDEFAAGAAESNDSADQTSGSNSETNTSKEKTSASMTAQTSTTKDTQSFSVKDFYWQQILAKDPGAKPPR